MEEDYVDLSRYVKEGYYDIVIPSYNPETGLFEDNYISGIYLNDNRPVSKKAIAITGAVVTIGGLLKPSIAAIIVVLIIIAISLYYYLKGDKSSDNDVPPKIDDGY